jgi:beta-lactamase superfamily II metal-dependent hydrolase
MCLGDWWEVQGGVVEIVREYLARDVEFTVITHTHGGHNGEYDFVIEDSREVVNTKTLFYQSRASLSV